MNISQEEVFALLGAKEIEIYLLHKKISELQTKIIELSPKSEAQPLKAVE